MGACSAPNSFDKTVPNSEELNTRTRARASIPAGSTVPGPRERIPGEDYRPLRPPPLAGAFGGSGGASASESLKSSVLDFSLTSAVRFVVRGSP